jgi:hypothetical protein
LRLVVVFAIGDDDNDRCSAWEGTDVSYAKLDNTDAAVVSHLVVHRIVIALSLPEGLIDEGRNGRHDGGT